MQLLVFIFLCIVWGTTWVAIKMSLEGLPPFLSASFRFAFALVLLFLYTRIMSVSIRVKRKDFGVLALSAFLMYTFDYGLIYWGEQYLSAGITAIFFATFPIFTAVWANFLFRNEAFHWVKFLGLLLGFAGIFIVFYDQLIITQFDQKVIIASLAIVIGAAGGAMSVVIVKKYLPGINPISLTFNQMLLGFFSLLVFGMILENVNQIHFNLRVIVAVIYLGAIGSALAFALYYWLLKQLSAITLSLIIYITPIVAIIFDYLVYGELIQIRTIIGMLVTFSGIALTQFNLNQLRKIVLMAFNTIL